MKKRILSFTVAIFVFMTVFAGMSISFAATANDNQSYIPKSADILWSADFDSYDGSSMPAGLALKGSGVSAEKYEDAIKLDVADASGISPYDAPGLRINLPYVSEDVTCLSADLYFDSIDAQNATNYAESDIAFSVTARSMAVGDVWWATGDWFLNADNIKIRRDLSIGDNEDTLELQNWYTLTVRLDNVNSTYSVYLKNKSTGEEKIVIDNNSFEVDFNSIAIIDLGLSCVESIIMDNLVVFKEPVFMLKSPGVDTSVSNYGDFTLSATVPDGFESITFAVDGETVGDVITEENDDSTYDCAIENLSDYESGIHSVTITAEYPGETKTDSGSFYLYNDTFSRNILPNSNSGGLPNFTAADGHIGIATFNGAEDGADVGGYFDPGTYIMRNYAGDDYLKWRQYGSGDIAMVFGRRQSDVSSSTRLFTYLNNITAATADIKVLEFDIKPSANNNRFAVDAGFGLDNTYYPSASTTVRGAILDRNGKIYGSTTGYKANEWAHIRIECDRNTGYAQVFYNNKFVNKTPFDVSTFEMPTQGLLQFMSQYALDEAPAESLVDNISLYTLKRPMAITSLSYIMRNGETEDYTSDGQILESIEKINLSLNVSASGSEIELKNDSGAVMNVNCQVDGNSIEITPVSVLKPGVYTLTVSASAGECAVSFVIGGTAVTLTHPSMDQVIPGFMPFDISSSLPMNTDVAKIYLDGVVKATFDSSYANNEVAYTVSGDELAGLAPGAHTAKVVVEKGDAYLEDSVVFYIGSATVNTTAFDLDFENYNVGDTPQTVTDASGNRFMTDSGTDAFDYKIIDRDGGKALYFEHKSTSSPDGYGPHFYLYASARSVIENASTDIVVLEFDVMPKYNDEAFIADGTGLNLYNSTFRYYQMLQSDGKVYGGNADYKAGKWQKVSFVFEKSTGMVSCYFENKLVAHTAYDASKFGNGVIRFGLVNTNHADSGYAIDNFVYRGYSSAPQVVNAVYTRTDNTTVNQSGLYNLAEISDVKSIDVVFDRDISGVVSASDVQLIRVRTNGEGEIGSDVTVNGNKITLTPAAELFDGSYYLKITVPGDVEYKVNFKVSSKFLLSGYESAIVAFNTGVAKSCRLYKAVYSKDSGNLKSIEIMDIVVVPGESVLSAIPQISSGTEYAKIFVWNNSLKPLASDLVIE